MSKPDEQKDDLSDDLDIDQEAALLGHSDDDEDISEETTEHPNVIEQELEYVDEEGNPVDIGENNADLYELAEYEGNEQKFTSTSQDDDVLEVDVDELESFSPEATDTPESTQEPPPPPPPAKKPSPKETRYQENLISVPLVQSKDVPKAAEAVVPQLDEQHIKTEEIPVTSSFEVDTEEVPSSRFELEESEEENVEEDDHRDRFKSERSNIITLTSAKRRTDIPDSLDSVISDEENAKVQAFLAKEQKRKQLRIKNRNIGRGKPFASINRDQSNMGFPNTHPQQAPFQSAPIPVSTPQPRIPPQPPFHKMPAAASAPRPRMVQQVPYQKTPVTVSPPQPKILQSAAPRKILINPHFRGPRPNTSASESSFQQTQVSQISPTSPQLYEQYPSAFSSSTSNSSMYTYDMGHGDSSHVYSESCHPISPAEHPPPPPFTHQTVVPIPTSAPPNYGQPLPPVPFHPNEPPPPLHISSDMGHLQQMLQAPTDLWMNPPPNMGMASTQSYPTQPPPVPTYQEPPPPLSSASVSSFTAPPVSSTFATTSFQNQRVPVSLPVGYRPDQPPPTHQPPPLPHFNPVNSSGGHTQQFQPVVSHVTPLVSTQQARFSMSKESPAQNSQQNQRPFNQTQRQNFIRRAQKFGGRQAEKRPANTNIRTPPSKLARIETVQRNANIQVRAVKNSNIREIPLVENIQHIPTINSPMENTMEQREYVEEEEDEETRELRMKIEEQKRLREQIMKRKEERRRQMAVQRMEELKLRKLQEQESGPQNNASSDDTMTTSLNVITVNVQPKVNATQRASEPSNIQQIVPQGRQLASQPRTGASSMRPSVPQVRPSASRVVQPASVRQPIPQVRQPVLQIRQAAPQVRQATPQVRQTTPAVRQAAPQVRQAAPQVRQATPQVRQTVPQVRPTASPMRPAFPQVRQATPQVRQAIQQVRQATPQVKQAAPQVRQAAPQVRQAAPQVRQATPQVRQATPQVRQATPQTRPASCAVRQSSPQMRQATPQVRQATPQMRQTTPQMRQTTPQMRQTTPQMRQTTPQMRQNTPQMRQTSSPVRQTSPQIRQATPQVKPAASPVRQATPQFRQAAPQVKQAALQVQEASPQIRQVSPQVREASQVVQTAPEQAAPQVATSTTGSNIISTKKKVVVVRKKCDTVAQTLQNPPQEPKKAVSVHDRLGPRPVAKRIKLTKTDAPNQQTAMAQNTAQNQLSSQQQQKSSVKQPIRPPETSVKQPVRPPEATKNVPVQNVKPLPRMGGAVGGPKIIKLGGQLQTSRQQRLKNQIQRKYFQKRGHMFQKGPGPKQQNHRPWMRNFMKPRMQSPRLQVQHQKSPVAQGQEHMYMNVLPPQRMPQNALGQRMPSPRFPGPRNPTPPFHMPPFQNQPPPPPPSPNNPLQMQRMPYMPYNNNSPPNMPPQGYMNPERMQHTDFFYHHPPNENFVPPPPPPQRMPGPGPHPGANYQPWGQPGGSTNAPRPRMPPPPPVQVMYNERPPPFFHQEQRPVPFQKRRFPEPNFQGQRMPGPPRPRFIHQSPIRSNRPPYHMGRGLPQHQRPKMFANSHAERVAPASVTSESAPPKIVNTPPKLPAKPEGDDKKPTVVSNCPPKVTQSQKPAIAASVPAAAGKSASQSVVVQNLSASTNEIQIKKLCTGVGPIELTAETDA